MVNFNLCIFQYFSNYYKNIKKILKLIKETINPIKMVSYIKEKLTKK